MALLPLSDAGKRLAQQVPQTFAPRCGYLTPQWNGEAIPLTALDRQALNDEDWRVSYGRFCVRAPPATDIVGLLTASFTAIQRIAITGAERGGWKKPAMPRTVRPAAFQAVKLCWRCGDAVRRRR